MMIKLREFLRFMKLITLTVVMGGCVLLSSQVAAANDNPDVTADVAQAVNTARLYGQTKYETAKVISESYNSGTVHNVILSTGNDFADALSASVLAHEKEAPILLVDYSVEDSKAAFEYIRQHLDAAGTVYIIGGVGIISKPFETELQELGFSDIRRIAGWDRYQTSYEIARSLSSDSESTVVISSGEQFPDALSISGFAAQNGWPILLTPQTGLPQDIKSFLQAKSPEQVYITGGTGIISADVEAEIINLLPQASVRRLMGTTRFETNTTIAATFAPNPTTLYIATGYDFADALAGSVLAAQNGDPLLFTDPSTKTLPKTVAAYLAEFSANEAKPNLVALGGTGIISDETLDNVCKLMQGTVVEMSIYSIDDISVMVTQNDDYSLPDTIPATLYNSDIENVYVQWNPGSAGTGKVGSYVYEGTVGGCDRTIKLELTVLQPPPKPPELIGQYTTYFNGGQINRTHNIQVAAKTIDGKVLAPGERFSFNQTVGERTVAAGYREALVIEGDAFVPGLGGGVCQVSSTLYNAVLLADLQIVERHPHSLPVDYVPDGKDATVAYPVLDFRFRNSKSANIIIRCSVEENSLTFMLYEEKE